MKLGEVADIVRSKNAGINHITIEVMFDDPDTYNRVKDSSCLTPSVISDIYDKSDGEFEFFEYDPGNSFKIVLQNEHTSGSPKDRDLRGAQQHPPVYNIECPVEPA